MTDDLAHADAQLAEGVLEAAGGVANVTEADQCFTRLRLLVRRIDAVDFTALLAVPGVRLAFEQAGEVHLVVGMRLGPAVRAVRTLLDRSRPPVG